MRMGLHVQADHDLDRAVAYCAEVKPALMKWLDPKPEILRRCKEASPGTRHVWRYYWSEQKPERRGDFDAAVVKRIPALRGLIDWVEGWNEYGCSTQTDEQVASLRNFCQSEVQFAKKVNAAGMGAAIGGFSTGALDAGDRGFNAVLPLLQFLHQTGPTNVWHSHEYSAPYIGWGWRTPDGKNQWDHARNVWTGSSPRDAYLVRGLDGWWTLRCLMLWRRLEVDGLTNVRMIFTETGLDDIQPRPGGQGKGWRDWDTPEWTGIMGDYADQQYAYGWQLSWLPWCLGWVDYGFATVDPAWRGERRLTLAETRSFDLSQRLDMFERTKTRMKDLPIGHFEEAPMIEGVDVSHHQGRMDWAITKAKRVSFAVAKATEGKTFLDDEHARNVTQAQANGIAVGAYHYYSAAVPWAEQVEWMAGWIRPADLDLPVVLDLEDTSTAGVSEQQVRQFVEAVEARFGRPIIYTGMWWINLVGAYQWAWLAKYPLWLADYTAPYLVPDPWDSWTILQYSNAGDGKAYGAQSAKIDLDRTRLTLDQLRALRTKPTQTATLDTARLVSAAEAEHRRCGVRYNGAAGLWQAIIADGLVPTTNEFEHIDDSGHYAAQRAEGPGGAFVYYWDERTGRAARVPIA